MTDARYRSPWEVPDCPDCGGHVFVSGHDHPDRGAWHCHACGATFDGEVPRRASREGVDARPIGDGKRLVTDGGQVVSMYCPECDQMVPENWDEIDEAWRCEKCHSRLYESKERYIQGTHACARFQKENGWGAWYDGEDGDPE